MRFLICLVLAGAFGFAPAGNLIVNGNFEQDLSEGWTYEWSGYGSRVGERRPWSAPDTGHYCFLRQFSGPGFARLHQTASVAGPDLGFSFRAFWAIGGGSSTCWPVAAILLEYCDAGGARLGETVWYFHNQYCNWEPSDDRHLISITDPEWRRYAINVRDEIVTNLPAVNADEVRKVKVTVYSFTSDG